jgi:hypothetical protein
LTTRPGLPAIPHGVQGVKRKEGGKEGSSRQSVSAKKKTPNTLKQFLGGRRGGVGAVIYSQIFSFCREFGI